MKKHFRPYSMLGILVIFFLSCQHPPEKGIQPDTLILPRGARVLICGARKDVFTYEILKFRHDIIIPGIVFVGPPHLYMKGSSLEKLVGKMIQETKVHIVLVIRPDEKLLKRYNPYRLFKGWDRRTYRDSVQDGRAVYRTKKEPVFETRYKHKCMRTTYLLYQYDKKGQLIGSMDIMDPTFPGCPEKTDKDMHFDDTEYLMTWLRTNISAK